MHDCKRIKQVKRGKQKPKDWIKLWSGCIQDKFWVRKEKLKCEWVSCRQPDHRSCLEVNIEWFNAVLHQNIHNFRLSIDFVCFWLGNSQNLFKQFFMEFSKVISKNIKVLCGWRAVAMAVHKKCTAKHYGPIFKGNEAYKRKTWRRVSFTSFIRCVRLYLMQAFTFSSSLSFKQSAWIKTKYMTFLPSEWWNITLSTPLREIPLTFVSSSNNSYAYFPFSAISNRLFLFFFFYQ